MTALPSVVTFATTNYCAGPRTVSVGRLDRKVALITGAARGTGAATSRRFAAEGARVVLADVLDEAGQAVAASIGPSAAYLHLDVTSEADWTAGVAFVGGGGGGRAVFVLKAP
jgi:NAD(P)-dependent dehydrogenase (short-subunit alcohol dehydrogenase family)